MWSYNNYLSISLNYLATRREKNAEDNRNIKTLYRNVHVEGTVIGSQIHAGKNAKRNQKVGGNLKTGDVENSTLEANGNINTDSVKRSQLSAKGNIKTGNVNALSTPEDEGNTNTDTIIIISTLEAVGDIKTLSVTNAELTTGKNFKSKNVHGSQIIARNARTHDLSSSKTLVKGNLRSDAINGSQIITFKDVTAKKIENSTIKALGNVTVNNVNGSMINAKKEATINGDLTNSEATAEKLHVKGGVKEAKIVCSTIVPEGTLKNTTIFRHQQNGIFKAYKVGKEIKGNELAEHKTFSIDLNSKDSISEALRDDSLSDRDLYMLKTYAPAEKTTAPKHSKVQVSDDFMEEVAVTANASSTVPPRSSAIPLPALAEVALLFRIASPKIK
ncbi:MAG: DUF342 domain-containing protein [Alphaproteobacteria bacterium]|nr:DUF342 domain-containing protein [Alphaproteobacteria bacterium]